MRKTIKFTKLPQDPLHGSSYRVESDRKFVGTVRSIDSQGRKWIALDVNGEEVGRFETRKEAAEKIASILGRFSDLMNGVFG